MLKPFPFKDKCVQCEAVMEPEMPSCGDVSASFQAVAKSNYNVVENINKNTEIRRKRVQAYDIIKYVFYGKQTLYNYF